MVASEACLPTEAALQRACGSLFVTHGLESTCGLAMWLFFSVIAVKLHCRGHLRSPALAFVRFCLHHASGFAEEFVTTLYTVWQMHDMKLEVRLRFCGNLDKMANATSAVLSALGITRWLSIGNINGMRYIGYALTCPMTQLELVVMLAPIVPCYRVLAFLSFTLTLVTLTCGYAASLLWMPVWDGDATMFLQTWDLDVLAPTRKFFVVLPALAGISILWVLILPFLVIMYTVYGGNKNFDLPQEYRFLVSLVWITWLCFPIWWLLSWEGNGVIEDTKVNEIGFTVLNMTAKGLFTLQSFRVGELNDVRVAARRGYATSPQKGKDEAHGILGYKAHPSSWSCEGIGVPDVISRASSRKLSASRFVKILRMYDEDNEGEAAVDREHSLEAPIRRPLGQVLRVGDNLPTPKGRNRNRKWISKEETRNYY
uniref:Uncharacterized protein n=1 Tax=Alexandrium monilatum TaxID=311494 RepID=A0A7S4UEE1_9DINO|mmetsp:Transcript_89483/g.276800  ORF Transcript_89483/g.276800 Transcript_89483/m.276800 type:complete len:427 (+) Transcript_89483:107-1387(+)